MFLTTAESAPDKSKTLSIFLWLYFLNDAGRIPGDNSHWRNILCHHGIDSHNAAVTEGDAGKNRGIDAEPHLVLDFDRLPVCCAAVISNLIVNAVRNSGQVEVSLTGGRLVVSNPSQDGRPLDSDRLFRRFASTSGPKGNGLGLAIAKAICDFHFWKIEYVFVDGKHLFIVEMGR